MQWTQVSGKGREMEMQMREPKIHLMRKNLRGSLKGGVKERESSREQERNASISKTNISIRQLTD